MSGKDALSEIDRLLCRLNNLLPTIIKDPDMHPDTRLAAFDLGEDLVIFLDTVFYAERPRRRRRRDGDEAKP